LCRKGEEKGDWREEEKEGEVEGKGPD